jgi:lysophospholipase L1-like esterase
VTTDAWGERRTLPESHAERTVIVVGDSISFGVLVDDSETLASQLQSRDPQHRYRNLGIPGIPAHDVLCALDRGLARQPGKVDAIVYTYCENDFESEDDLASPEPVIERLRAAARAAGVERVVVVYAPYLYNVLPQLTRFPGQHSDRVQSFRDQHARLRKAVHEAGFEWVDFSELMQPEIDRTGTQFAAFALFIEQNHWSREGTRRVADRVQPLLAGAAAGPSAAPAAERARH